MKENIKKFILYHNNKTYHLSYEQDNSKPLVYSLDYIPNINTGDKVDMKIIYNSDLGIVNKDLDCVCVDPLVKGKKVTSFKFKRRQNYSRTVGYSASYTLVQINNIMGGK